MGISTIKAEIDGIRKKRSALQQEAAAAKQNADKAASPEKDEHMKAHITAGAKDQDLSVAQDTKEKALAQLSFQGQQSSPDEWSLDKFDQQWNAMREKLRQMIGALHQHVTTIKSVAQKHFDALKEHMDQLKQAQMEERSKRVAAEKAHAE